MGAWIEIFSNRSVLLSAVSSHPTMGAWIEIIITIILVGIFTVAPHDGCVD